MRRLFGMLLTGISLLPLSAEPISKGDREFGLSALHASRKLFLDSVAGLSDAQLNFKPAPGRWSIAEIAEHVALSEQFIFQEADAALNSPAREKMADPGKMDEKILAAIPDRSVKATAPQALRPQNHFKSAAEAVAAFKSLRDAHIKYLSETRDRLREHFFKNPVMGDVAAFQ
jgi:AraC-like DNA-binding protein